MPYMLMRAPTRSAFLRRNTQDIPTFRSPNSLTCQYPAVGLNERRDAEAGISVDVDKLPRSYLARALTARDARGFIKLIKERGSDRLLGASILAPEAGDIIVEPALAIRHGIGVSELVAAFHPYLTQAEGIRLAAQTFEKDVAKLSCCA